MADQIRHDARSGLGIRRDRAASAGESVRYDGAGGFEVRDPGPSLMVPFVRAAVAASLVGGTAALIYGTSAVLEFTLPYAFRLVGLQLGAPANLSGGTLTAKVRRNGTEVATLGIASGSKHAPLPIGWRAGAQFATGDLMTVVYDTDAAFAPSQNIMLNALIAVRP